MTLEKIHRREFCQRLAGGVAVSWLGAGNVPGAEARFRLRYILASCMYGKQNLARILPEVRKTQAESIDIWPLSHGNQREQINEMGMEAFGDLLKQHQVRLGILTHYDLGPFRLQDEMKVAQQLGGKMIICGGQGPRNLQGNALKAAVQKFAEQLRPHVGWAQEHGIVIGIENHGNNLIESPDSMRWLVEFVRSDHLGIALAPYHLPQDAQVIAGLIEDLGNRMVHFYAWQHGMGCHKKLPKEQELLQLPGRGELDFGPILSALKKNKYRGWTEIFMHPVPRGIPILPTAAEVTTEINRSRRYLESCLQKGTQA
jgi:sugar phosphate isomerase/epimerase